MAPLPLLKIASLALRTISKPLTSQMMKRTKNRPTVQRICEYVGETVHQLTSRLNIVANGYRVVTINPLPKEDALNSGVSIMSEFIVFSFAGTLVTYEYFVSENEKAVKSAKSAEKEQKYRQSIQDRFSTLDRKSESLAQKLNAIEQAIRCSKEDENNKKKGSWFWS
mmetsp:Transcript_22266/g.37248  ORF Transcript_22266/g.37248 Transcript_22266/m.37248 type:complete len:167 (+) Transcript_22266:99-599(+)